MNGSKTKSRKRPTKGATETLKRRERKTLQASVCVAISNQHYEAKEKGEKMKKINVTDAQIQAIKRMADTLKAMVGCADEESGFDKEVTHDVRLVDRMLEKNNLAPRDYK